MCESPKKVFWILMFWYSLTAIVSSLVSLIFAEFNYYVFGVLLIGMLGMYAFYACYLTHFIRDRENKNDEKS